ncbi:ABC-type sugar transport system substrate-binding protein [Paucibacter oligotrophus]|uniref:ABC-type sugar transport system substrate-binding protein n=1 Tax=Roseateles oligotrophus TaxID=1769250 RepID=A0A840L2V1_9BURK|nr:ABC transporter substrate-binding protein [Roseateles oligotrophus]MBB4842266.1 ABC-type sugar transport system substrate-binding protein [Roseateles oligotrophus]
MRFLIALLCGMFCQQVVALSVTFINPGRSDEAYWVTAGKAAQAAANSLGMKFEQIYAERDPLRVLEIARGLAARPKESRPDYALLTNDKQTLLSTVRILERAGIKSFAAFSGLTDEERAQFGEPRSGVSGLIGSLEPQGRDAGYLTAQALIKQGRRLRLQAPDGKLHLLALAGDRSTPASLQRNLGLQQALAEQPDVVLDQQVYADWRRDKAGEQMSWLLRRHPQARLLWAASDQMAFGALEVLELARLTPGRDALVSAINTSPEAMQALLGGRLSALAGGHFMCGAWGLVMLYDYHHGRDFADQGLELSKPMFILFDKNLAERYLARFGNEGRAIDFRSYSRVLNPARRHYEFDFEALLK